MAGGINISTGSTNIEFTEGAAVRFKGDSENYRFTEVSVTPEGWVHCQGPYQNTKDELDLNSSQVVFPPWKVSRIESMG